MEGVIMLIVILVGIVILIKNKDKIIKNNTKFPYTFKKKKFLLTQNERKFYNILKENLKEYEIMSRIRIIDIIEPYGGGKNYIIAKNKIIQKRIDFLVLTKKYLNPVLAIELNENTPSLIKKNERDTFLTLAFESAGLPILFFTTNDLNNPEYIINTIKNKINS